MSSGHNWAAKLEAVHSNASARVDEPADWEEVAGRARRATIGSALLQSSARVVDEIRDSTIDNLPGDLAAALHRVAPDFDLGALDAYPQAAMEGLANLIKGALFELRVAAGVSGGSIGLPDGIAGFHLVDNFDMPGFDAEMLDSHGHLVDVVQLKASSHDSIIREALQKWPGIDHFMTTTEAATEAARHGIANVADTGISDVALSHEVHGALLDQVSTSFGEVFDEIVPQITLVIIGAQMLRRLSKGEPRHEVFEWARSRAATATVTSTIAGVAAMATGTDAIRIPTVIGLIITKGLLAEIDRSAGAIRQAGHIADQLVVAR